MRKEGHYPEVTSTYLLSIELLDFSTYLKSKFWIKQPLANRADERLKKGRARIAGEEAKKAKLDAATDLEEKTKEIIDLQDGLKQRDEYLAEAKKAQREAWALYIQVITE